ncbi:ribulokinase [Sediminicurvatus halobius]|uniref:Ribulokinase n=1 Tax=Sediminicurvatus halobius TaxID=2182432 RepID=A0A2U2N1F4_9GAMM|nr:ribulokinase [Spiribacter halobius]PWG62799.1 ribulokinase [Spiribacter halobius]UEX77054.1 ribulokinase [Spiribacter halobius]
MAGSSYVIGIDFGTGSARAVLVDAADGRLAGHAQAAYPHGVMTGTLPGGEALPPDWALQDADDYLAVTRELLTSLGERARADRAEVLAVGLDFTASTPLPARADGAPLSRLHPGAPHAYVKLWKHHAAEPWAQRLNARGGDFLRYTGGMTSCEWLPAKAGQLASEAPALWAETERFIEAGDWMVWQLTGREVRSSCQAGYKAHHVTGEGYPEALEAEAPGLRARLAEPRPIGTAAGALGGDWLRETGLPGEPVVAVATVDAHAVVPAVGVARPGALVASLGTSACHLMVDPHCHCIPGVAGVVRDGILPGYWGYECGQAGFGDLLAWFVAAFAPDEPREQAFARFREAAAALAPGESGVLALDWWHGCRTPLMNPGLSGLFVGMTLETSPAALYRALLESLCLGTRRVIDTLTGGGLAVNALLLTSGLAERNPLLVRLMADITGRSVQVPEVTEATARGAAIHALAASGAVAGFDEAVARLGARSARSHEPDPAAVAVYDELYALYGELAGQFGDGRLMARLRALQPQRQPAGGGPPAPSPEGC